ncbi:hypothetical protein EUGRSUZ_C03221 [Eucalyptus grandis]|uniref:Uncharacterized protein n=2 Tax=Eucalyptus grandis TaxID=71139 RepID=A0ACC3LID8_EUCGR|nr:hypothetical protein EUGRSUZ_C03221 [Eucalyptus grandis]
MLIISLRKEKWKNIRGHFNFTSIKFIMNSMFEAQSWPSSKPCPSLICNSRPFQLRPFLNSKSVPFLNS